MEARTQAGLHNVAVEWAEITQTPSHVWFEPTAISKTRKIFDCEGMDKIHIASPNANEFLEWAKCSGFMLT
ncbi:hypothetical protein KIN20_030890, partial [Parelaphostrongylus tenuis]